MPVEVRTQACDMYLEATLRTDIALESAGDAETPGRTGSAANAANGGIVLRLGSAGSTGNAASAGKNAEKGQDYGKRLEGLRAKYIGYNESRAIHMQSQILDRKMKRKRKQENERLERERGEKMSVVAEKGKERHEGLQMITKLVKFVRVGGVADGSPAPATFVSTLAPFSSQASFTPPTPPPFTPPTPFTPLHTPATPPSFAPSPRKESNRVDDVIVVNGQGQEERRESGTKRSSIGTSTEESGERGVKRGSVEVSREESGERGVKRTSIGTSEEENEERVTKRASLGTSGGINREIAESAEGVRMMAELSHYTKKLEKQKATTEKQKKEIEKLKEENEKMKEMHRTLENKFNNLQEKYDDMKGKYQKAKELKHKYHQLEIDFVTLKTKAEMHQEKEAKKK